MSTRSETLPKSLVTAVMLMTLVVLALGAAVLAVKLRPEGQPTTAVDRNLDAWKKAVIADPKDDAARTGLGLAYLDAGQEEQAREAFQQALDINNKNWMALFRLGLLSEGSDPARALDLLGRAARFAPRMSKATPLVAEGDFLMKRGDAAGAESAYRLAIEDVPYLLDAHLGLGRALEALGDEEGAMKEYKEARRFDPSNQEVADAIARLQGTG